MIVIDKKNSTASVNATCFSLFSKRRGFFLIHATDASTLSLTT